MLNQQIKTRAYTCRNRCKAREKPRLDLTRAWNAERSRRVVESCVQAEEIEELARELHQRGRVAFAVCCDSTNRDILGTGRVGSGRV